MAISIEHARELDGRMELQAFVRHVRLTTVDHEDNVDQMRALAEVAGVDAEDFSLYVWLQAYINESRISHELPPIDLVAREFGVSEEQFVEYIDERSKAFHDERREVEIEATARGLSCEEWEDYMTDLQEEAGSIGEAW